MKHSDHRKFQNRLKGNLETLPRVCKRSFLVSLVKMKLLAKRENIGGSGDNIRALDPSTDLRFITSCPPPSQQRNIFTRCLQLFYLLTGLWVQHGLKRTSLIGGIIAINWDLNRFLEVHNKSKLGHAENGLPLP